MVDFKKRLAGKRAERPIDPVKLYDTPYGLVTLKKNAREIAPVARATQFKILID